MNSIAQKISVVGIMLMMAVLVGCGGTPESNQMLNDAENSYQKAQNDTTVVRNAAVALDEAGDAVDQAQAALKKGADKEIVNHRAYLAQQKVEIARQTAKLNAAQDEVKRAESQRQKVLIKARQAEAERAQRKAEQKQQQAEEAMKEAKAAQARAQKLADRIDELEAQQTKRGLVLTLGDVLFDVDKAKLKAGGQRAVNELSGFLKDYDQRDVQIEGYTDNTGSNSYNQKLSERRAEAVQQALIADGIAASRIKTKGLGEQYPKASNNTSAGRQQNRRVEVIISDKNGVIKPRQ